MADIVIDAKDLEELSAAMELYPMESKKAMSYALNRTLSKGITFTAQEVKKEYPSIIRKDVKELSRVKKASPNKLEASIDYQGPRLKASKFPHTIARNRFRSPVTLRIKGGGATSGSNPVMFGDRNKEVFKRSAGSRKVKTVYTLSVPQMISADGVSNEILERMSEFYVERLMHELSYRLGKIYGG